MADRLGEQIQELDPLPAAVNRRNLRLLGAEGGRCLDRPVLHEMAPLPPPFTGKFGPQVQAESEVGVHLVGGRCELAVEKGLSPALAHREVILRHGRAEDSWQRLEGSTG